MISGRLELSSLADMLRQRGLEENGSVQKFIDSEVIRKCDSKVPMDQGELKRSVVAHSVLGSGIVKYATPYARYLYYGQLMVARNGSAWAKSGEVKYVTSTSLKFQGGPERGAYWFARMKQNGGKDEILKGAKRLAGAR